MDNMNEMKLNEMETVSGGRGGSPNPLPERAGCDRYKIASGNTLSGIANKFHTTVDYLMYLNQGYITNKNDITAGFWIYVPKQK